MIALNPYKNLAFIASILLTATTHAMWRYEYDPTTKALIEHYTPPTIKYPTYFQRLALYHECAMAIKAQKPLTQFPPQLDLEFTDTDGTSLLHVAVEADHHEAVIDFLKKGANPNQKNVHHITPFHLAIENQSRNCCLALIQHGATKESMLILDPSKNSDRSKKLYAYKGKSQTDREKYFAFMAPVYSALMNKELMPFYRRQQKELTLFPNFILKYYLYQHAVPITPIFEYIKRQSELQKIRYLIIHKFLEVSDCPVL